MTNSLESIIEDVDVMPDQNATANLADACPTVSFQSISFSDGTEVSFEPNDVVVFVGPNNAGKSLALREIEQHVGNHSDTMVIRSTNLHKTGTAEELSAYFLKYAQVRTQVLRGSILVIDIPFKSEESQNSGPTTLIRFVHSFVCAF